MELNQVNDPWNHPIIFIFFYLFWFSLLFFGFAFALVYIFLCFGLLCFVSSGIFGSCNLITLDWAIPLLWSFYLSVGNAKMTNNLSVWMKALLLPFKNSVIYFFSGLRFILNQKKKSY